MKKVLGIVFFGFLICNISFAQQGVLMSGNQINNEFKNKTLFGYYKENKVSFYETYNSDRTYSFISGGKTSKGKWKTRGNKVCIKFNDMNSYECVKVLRHTKNGDTYYFFANNEGVFAGASPIENKETKKKKVQTSKDVILKCSNSKNGSKSIIINESENKIIFDGYKVNTKIIWGNKVKFMSPDPSVKSKFSNHTEVTLDRITGELLAPNWPSEFDRLFVPRFQCTKVKALF